MPKWHLVTFTASCHLRSAWRSATVAIAQTGMLDAVAALAARRCHAAVLFASGYAEIGEEGRQRQDLLVQAAGAMHLVGPNCMGFTNFEAGAFAGQTAWPKRREATFVRDF